MHAMGSGFDFSNLDDPVSRLKELNEIIKQIENSKMRQGSMGMLDVEHPKVMEFIQTKRDEDF